PRLLPAWGITYDAHSVIGDLQNATQVQVARGQIERFPVWLSLTAEALNDETMATAELDSLLFVEPGSLSAAADSGLTFTPLITSSEQSGSVPAASLQFAQPADVIRQLTPDGSKVLAALVTGNFKTAFPDGAPKAENAEDNSDDTSEKDAGSDETTTENASTDTSEPAARTEGRGTLIVVADSDWLLDDYSVRRLNFLGIQAAEPINDNLALGTN